MKLFITGSAGFLGRHVVAEALARGHTVAALIRNPTTVAGFSWASQPNLKLVRGDLRSRASFEEALVGVDCVIHAAAVKSGDLYAQLTGTVVSTENLLHAMGSAGVRQLVSISTFSVYDYSRIPWLSVLDETSPVERDAAGRDEYARTKLFQERLVLEECARQNWSCIVLRPGAIYGKGSLWTARLGMGEKGSTWLLVGGFARIPVTYVENCAEAVLLSAEQCAGKQCVINVVDDHCPTQLQYAAALRRKLPRRPRLLLLPLAMLWGAAGVAALLNRLAFSGQAKLPGILIPRRLAPRFKALRYSNRSAREILGWRPRYDLEGALSRACTVAGNDRSGTASSCTA
jgi:nucleoside-diphosphate-sugar epimerase